MMKYEAWSANPNPCTCAALCTAVQLGLGGLRASVPRPLREERRRTDAAASSAGLTCRPCNLKHLSCTLSMWLAGRCACPGLRLRRESFTCCFWLCAVPKVGALSVPRAGAAKAAVAACCALPYGQAALQGAQESRGEADSPPRLAVPSPDNLPLAAFALFPQVAQGPLSLPPLLLLFTLLSPALSPPSLTVVHWILAIHRTRALAPRFHSAS
eukprot:6190476-Pleurochrysis_carterae.AAC.2